MMTHPYENCLALNPNRVIFEDKTTVFSGKHNYQVYQVGWNSYNKNNSLDDTNYFEVWTAYSKGYYHILLLKTDGGMLHNLPRDWEIIRDYDNGVVTYYEEDRN